MKLIKAEVREGENLTFESFNCTQAKVFMLLTHKHPVKKLGTIKIYFKTSLSGVWVRINHSSVIR